MNFAMEAFSIIEDTGEHMSAADDMLTNLIESDLCLEKLDVLLLECNELGQQKTNLEVMATQLDKGFDPATRALLGDVVTNGIEQLGMEGLMDKVKEFAKAAGDKILEIIDAIISWLTKLFNSNKDLIERIRSAIKDIPAEGSENVWNKAMYIGHTPEAMNNLFTMAYTAACMGELIVVEIEKYVGGDRSACKSAWDVLAALVEVADPLGIDFVERHNHKASGKLLFPPPVFDKKIYARKRRPVNLWTYTGLGEALGSIVNQIESGYKRLDDTGDNLKDLKKRHKGVLKIMFEGGNDSDDGHVYTLIRLTAWITKISSGAFKDILITMGNILEQARACEFKGSSGSRMSHMYGAQQAHQQAIRDGQHMFDQANQIHQQTVHNFNFGM